MRSLNRRNRFLSKFRERCVRVLRCLRNRLATHRRPQSALGVGFECCTHLPKQIEIRSRTRERCFDPVDGSESVRREFSYFGEKRITIRCSFLASNRAPQLHKAGLFGADLFTLAANDFLLRADLGDDSANLRDVDSALLDLQRIQLALSISQLLLLAGDFAFDLIHFRSHRIERHCRSRRHFSQSPLNRIIRFLGCLEV